MCGIVGYIGREQAAPILLEGLSRLEYRGYDSAGVAVFDGQTGSLAVRKAKGRLQVLSDQLHGGADLDSTAGVGHTRWATHGAPSDVNSHPQVSRSGKIAVVHNGIIENYAELKGFLQSKGVPFVSETDTEVVAQLIEYFYDGDLLHAVGRVLRRIQGSYALGILCADCPDQIVAVRKDSPLILGYGEGCNFIASDVTAILRHTRQVGYMEDGELAVLTREGIQCYNHLMQPIDKEIVTIDWAIDAAEKGGYEHFMFKEIMEQPEALRRCLSPRIREGEIVFEDFSLSDCYIKSINRIYIVACGSSYHVGMVGKYHLERLTRIPVEVALGSEFRYMDPIVDEHTLVIVISQSGETLDTMAAFRELPEKMEQVLSRRDDIQYFASQYFNHNSIFFMGRNLDYALGLEGSLKLKEISYIHSEAYASGELKHGTISLIEEGTLVVALSAYSRLFAKAMSNVVEVKARGADVLALTVEPHREEMAQTADGVMTIPDIHELLLPSLGVVPLQLFAYYVALMRGCDIDKPRNLAKSVTVE